MAVVVQKYGGSSVADAEGIHRVARRVVDTVRQGHQVVVVVSAMGNTTNELLALARRISPSPGRRELDMLISVGERIAMALLSMAVSDLGVPAQSFTGSQSGIITDESHSAARIVGVKPERIRAALADGKVAIVAGFQGMSRTREITTLGRGGSDLSAVALAAALPADWCEICSDVDGVYSADPRVVPSAIKLDRMSLDEALALARNGAKVLQAEAVAWAHREGIEIVASATASSAPGTVVQVAPLPPRFAAIAVDKELESFRAADLGALLAALSGQEIRAIQGDQVLVDLRNWHDRAAFSMPDGARSEGRVATVAATTGGVSVDPARALAAEEALRAEGVEVLARRADGGAMVWQLRREDADRAARALHAALSR